MRYITCLMLVLVSVIIMLALFCAPKPAARKQVVKKEPVKKEEPPPELIKGADLFELPKVRDPDEIYRTVSARMGGISYCYKKHIDQTGKTKGRIVIAFTVKTSGKVADVTIVESDFEKQDFYDCLVERVARWRFDEIAKDGEEPNVQYPFEF